MACVQAEMPFRNYPGLGGENSTRVIPSKTDYTGCSVEIKDYRMK